MIPFVLVLLFQSSLLLPPRTAMENPAVVSPVSEKLRKDYAKIWSRFIAGNEDGKLVKDVDKLLQKQKGSEAVWIVAGYLSLYRGDDNGAREKFTQALNLNPNNPIALYQLAEMAYAHGDYVRAGN